MRFVHTHLIPLTATLLLSTTVALWMGASEPVVPAMQAHALEPWILPSQTERNPKKSLDSINTRNLWGTTVAAAPKEPEWRVHGIANNGSESFVLIAFENKPLEILKTGDALPDGAKIVQIEKDRFFVLTREKKKIAFGIYKNVTQN